MQRLFIDGIDGLMDRATQLKGDAVYDTSPDIFNFATYYADLIPGTLNPTEILLAKAMIK